MWDDQSYDTNSISSESWLFADRLATTTSLVSQYGKLVSRVTKRKKTGRTAQQQRNDAILFVLMQ